MAPRARIWEENSKLPMKLPQGGERKKEKEREDEEREREGMSYFV
jgi:hypothetical protein